MLPVLMLFLIPIGGGIPAGVLLARSHSIAWPITVWLYFVSDVILALLFEPVLRLLIAAGRRIPRLARATEAMRQAMDRTVSQYGGSGAGPFALILIAFGVDPMTGRAAAAAAGHGFISGWTFAITGDMLYFGVIMVATLKLNSVIGDPNRTMALILAAMFLLPMLVRRVKAAYPKRSSRRAAA
jgi:hypothetical protein